MSFVFHILTTLIKQSLIVPIGSANLALLWFFLTDIIDQQMVVIIGGTNYTGFHSAITIRSITLVNYIVLLSTEC